MSIHARSRLLSSTCRSSVILCNTAGFFAGVRSSSYSFFGFGGFPWTNSNCSRFASLVDAQMNPDDFVEKTIASAPVVMFSKSYCPFCSRAKSALLGEGIVPVVTELDLLDGGAQVQKSLITKTGQRTVPSVWLSGKHVGGCDDTLRAIADGVFDSVSNSEQVSAASESGIVECAADDGIPCLCNKL